MDTSSLRRTQSMPAISTEAVGNLKKSIRSQSAPTKLDYSVCTSGLSLKSSRALNDTSIPPSQTLPTGDLKKHSITKTDEENLIQARQQLLTEAESLRHDDDRYSEIGEELRKTLIHPLSLPEGIELAPEVEEELRDIIKTADNYCRPADDELLNILPSDNHEITVSDSDSSSDSDNDNDSERKRYFIEDYRATKSHHPSHSVLKILTNTHDFYQAGRNGVISVTCGYIPKEPFDPYFLTKKIDINIKLKVTKHETPESFKTALSLPYPNLTKKQYAFLAKANKFTRYLGIYFQAKPATYALLANYFKEIGCPSALEVMAGAKGLTSAMLKKYGLTVRACDIQPYLMGKQYFPVVCCDAIEYLHKMGKEGFLKDCGLLLAAPPPYVVTDQTAESATTAISDYLPELFNVWHIYTHGPIVILSECTDTNELWNPELLTKHKIKLEPHPKPLPKAIIDGLSFVRGTAISVVIKDIQE